MKVWHSRDDGPWREIDVRISSIVGQAVAQAKWQGNRIYDDGYGNRYRIDDPEAASS